MQNKCPLALVIAALATGCGGTALGPASQPANTMDVVVDGSALSFTSIGMELTASGQSLRIIGSNDPSRSVADDGSSFIIDIKFDDLSALGSELTLSSSTAFTGGSTTNYGVKDDEVVGTPNPEQSVHVVSVAVYSQCFCSRNRDQDQSIQGELTVHTNSATQFQASLQLTVDGQIPVYDNNNDINGQNIHHATISANFTIDR